MPATCSQLPNPPSRGTQSDRRTFVSDRFALGCVPVPVVVTPVLGLGHRVMAAVDDGDPAARVGEGATTRFCPLG
ncbi:hypothetical protein GCM10010464_75440 [Pseudonocardia yunnanensis]